MPLFPRCLRCGYILQGLAPGDHPCPECGLGFNLDNPFTYSTKPLFIRWRFWLPGLLLSIGGGLIVWILLFQFTSIGWAATIVLPFSLRSLIGDRCRVRWLLTTMLAIGGLTTITMMMVTLKVEGLFCGLILGAIAAGPVFIGGIAGTVLRMLLKRSRFDQRDYLPTVALLLLPLAWGWVEHLVGHA